MEQCCIVDGLGQMPARHGPVSSCPGRGLHLTASGQQRVHMHRVWLPLPAEKGCLPVLTTALLPGAYPCSDHHESELHGDGLGRREMSRTHQVVVPGISYVGTGGLGVIRVGFLGPGSLL